MSSLTHRLRRVKPGKPGLRLLAALAAVALGGAGCATSGPNHVYLTTATSPAVHDLGPPPAVIAGAVRPGEQALGLAYDFNTDHLFVRIAPAQVIRVIERPSGKILREMPLPVELQMTGSADLAVRSGDRHLFAVHSDGRTIVELTLFGEIVRRLELPALGGAIQGLAWDQRQSRLLVLAGDTVRIFSPAGRELGSVKLQGVVRPASLGYDSDAQRYFVPLADGRELGEFDAAGNLVATHAAGDQPITAIDAGPRSLVRVF